MLVRATLERMTGIRAGEHGGRAWDGHLSCMATGVIQFVLAVFGAYMSLRRPQATPHVRMVCDVPCTGDYLALDHVAQAFAQRIPRMNYKQPSRRSPERSLKNSLIQAEMSQR